MELTTHINVLAGLSDEELQRVLDACEARSLEPGDQVFREDEEGDEVFIVRSGRVRVSKVISLDVDRTLAVLGEGGIFGELAMIGQGTRSASAAAMEPSEVLSLSREGFHQLTLQAPELGLKIMARFAATLAERLRLSTELLRDTVQWGLQVSGAAALDMQHLIHTNTHITVSLSNGVALTGALLKVENNEAGTTLLLRDEDRHLHMIPYHAVSAVRFSRDLLAAGEGA